MARTLDGRGTSVLVVSLTFATLLVTLTTTPLWAQQPAVAAPPPTAAATAETTATALPDEAMERFLKEGKIVKEKGTKKGITGSTQATLSDGTTTHDAHIQTIDDSEREFRSRRASSSTSATAGRSMWLPTSSTG